MGSIESEGNNSNGTSKHLDKESGLVVKKEVFGLFERVCNGKCR